VLYERHRASVLAVCMGVLGSRHDAEDASQEAFASLAVTLRRSPPDELRAWLARVARNASIDAIRRRRPGGPAVSELPEHAGPPTADGTELDSVLAGLRQLPESQRTALLMRELAGHSYKEIAVLLEIDEASVRGLIARARIGLRNHREATELPCGTARAALAAGLDGRRRPREVRHHLRTCAACRAYRHALHADAKALRGLLPVQASGIFGGGALAGGLAAKGVLAGAAVTQATAVCAVSVCAVGGVVLLDRHALFHHSTSGGARSGHAAGARHAGLGAVAAATREAYAQPLGAIVPRTAGASDAGAGTSGPAAGTAALLKSISSAPGVRPRSWSSAATGPNGGGQGGGQDGGTEGGGGPAGGYGGSGWSTGAGSGGGQGWGGGHDPGGGWNDSSNGSWSDGSGGSGSGDGSSSSGGGSGSRGWSGGGRSWQGGDSSGDGSGQDPGSESWSGGDSSGGSGNASGGPDDSSGGSGDSSGGDSSGGSGDSSGSSTSGSGGWRGSVGDRGDGWGGGSGGGREGSGSDGASGSGSSGG
jgi:RNA polymerase sigma factor (sigma-70 family)